MLLRLGVDLFEVPKRAGLTSSSTIGGHSRAGRGGGSSGWEGSTGGGDALKKRDPRAAAWPIGSSVREPSAEIKGGMRELDRPLRQRAAAQRLSVVAWSRKS